MKHALALVLIAVLAWGLWQLLGADPEVPRRVPGGSDWIETGDPGADDPRGADAPQGDGMRGVDDPPAGARGSGTGEAGARAGAQVMLRGRVVDTARRGVAGATIELHLRGAVAGRATSAGDGTWQMAVARGGHAAAARATLLARKPGHGAAALELWLGRDATASAPVLVLEPGHVLRARVEVDGEPRGFARVAVVQREGARITPMAESAAGADGGVVFEDLAAGLYEVYATLPGRGRGFAHARLPQAEGEVAVVSLGPERMLDVVVEDAADGLPVAGALVHVGDKRTLPPPTGPGYLPALPALRADAHGRVSVRGLGQDETVYVNAEAPGYVAALWWRASSQIARPGASEVRVRLQRPRRVTYPIYAGKAGVPADGTPLEVQLHGRRDEAVGDLGAFVEGDYVHVDGLPRTAVSGALVAPDGRQASFTAPAGMDLGNAVEFKAPGAVRIRLIQADGEPAVGVALRLNPLDGGAGPLPAAVTDAEGVAHFETIAGTKAAVHLRTADRPWGGPLLGRIDLSSGQTEFTFEVPSPLTFSLRVRIGGAARLPPRYTLAAGGQGVPAEAIEEEPGAGLLHVAMRPPAEDRAFTLQILADGYLPAEVEIDPTASDARYDVTLGTAGRIVARVTPPADGGYGLAVQRHDAALDRWMPAGPSGRPGATPAPSGDGVHVFDGLPAGRYRIVEARSGYESETLEVRPGGAPLEIAVDLSGAVDVEGRVEGPEGAALGKARVRIVGRHDKSAPWSGVTVAPDGTFRLRALRGASLELTVTHPVLSPAARGGRVTIRAGAGAPVLRLEEGARATFRVEGLAAAGGSASSRWGNPVQVRLYRGGELVHAVQPEAGDGAFIFGGFTPGTWTLWVSFGARHAPHVREGVSLGAGRTDLGTITPIAGETVILDLRGGPAGGSTAVWATATATGGPAYARHASRTGEAGEMRIEGLGAGSFALEVRVAGPAGTRVAHEETLSLDGKGETRLTIDLR